MRALPVVAAEQRRYWHVCFIEGGPGSLGVREVGHTVIDVHPLVWSNVDSHTDPVFGRIGHRILVSWRELLGEDLAAAQDAGMVPPA